MDQQGAVRQVFGSAAERYATSAVHVGGPDLDAMLAAADPSPGVRVLDLGCGAGHTALAFAARGAEVTGLDLTAAMLAQGRRMAGERGLSNVEFREGDAAAIPFPAAHFDVVTSRLSAHHYAQPRRAVAEVARVLRPGGRFFLVDSVSPADPAQDTFLNTIERLRDHSHVRDHSVAEWIALCAAEGLEAILLGSFKLRIGFADWVARVETPPQEVAMLRTLLGQAPDEVSAAFAVGADGSFDMPVALLGAERRTQIS